MSTAGLNAGAGLLRPHKRRKTQLACNPCRARKTGCDGSRPHCSQCLLRGVQEQCGYQDKAVEPSLPALVSLDKRLQTLEAGHQAHYRRFNTAEMAPVTEDNSDTRSTDRSQNTNIVNYLDSATYSSTKNHFVHSVASATAGPSDADFAAVAGNPFQTPHLATTLNVDDTGPSVPSCELVDMVLPPRQFADRILNWYWDHNHVLLPVLHRPSFTAAYERLWQPVDQQQNQQDRGPQTTVLYATLNMVLALGCQRSDSVEDIAEDRRLADEFYQRSIRLVSAEKVDNYSLSVVQLLVLRASYLLYGPYADRCWTILIVAIKAAQAIGLGAAKNRRAPMNQLTREMRRRVWYCCLAMDRLTAATFNQAPLIPRVRVVPAPAEIDDEYLSSTEEGRQPEGIPSFMTGNIYFYKLFSIGDRRHEVEEGNIQQNEDTYSGRDLGIALDILSDLDSLFEELPDFLKPGSYITAGRYKNAFELQAKTLQARAMFLRLWLLQPFLLAGIQKRTTRNALLSAPSAPALASEGLKQRLRNDMSKLCVSTAQEVLNRLYQVVLGNGRSTSPWHALYFTFAAGSVVVAATLCPELDVRLDSGTGQASWDQAIRIFQFCRQHVPTADRALEALSLFRRCVMKRAEAVRESGRDRRIVSEEVSADSNPALDPEMMEQLSVDWTQLLDSTSLDMAWLTSQDAILQDWLLPEVTS